MKPSIMNQHLLKVCQGQMPQLPQQTRVEIYNRVVQDKGLLQSSQLAIWCNYYCAQYLLEHGAKINCQEPQSKETPLIKAIRQQDLPLVTYLLSWAPDINLADEHGFTPLMHSLMAKDTKEHPMIFQAILDRNPDLGAKTRTNQACALHLSVKYPEYLGLLLQKGALVNQVDVKGKTALHYALFEQAPIASLKNLLKYGIDFTLKADVLKPVVKFTACQLAKTQFSPNDVRIGLLTEKDEVFKRTYQDMSNTSKLMYLTMFYTRNPDTQKIARLSFLPIELNRLILSNVQASDFIPLAKKKFFHKK